MELVFVLHISDGTVLKRPAFYADPLPRPGDRVTFLANESGYAPSGSADQEYVVTEIEHKVSNSGTIRGVAVHLSPAPQEERVMTDLAEIKAALAKTTPGSPRWFQDEWKVWSGAILEDGTEHGCEEAICHVNVKADGEWIAKAHDVHIPWLIAEIERLREVLGRQMENNHLTWDAIRELGLQRQVYDQRHRKAKP